MPWWQYMIVAYGIVAYVAVPALCATVVVGVKAGRWAARRHAGPARTAIRRSSD
jgi:hypothetical protein